MDPGDDQAMSFNRSDTSLAKKSGKYHLRNELDLRRKAPGRLHDHGKNKWLTGHLTYVA
jgi:hypothetical protein